MSSQQPMHVDAVGADANGSGFLTPDAGPDTSRADYSSDRPQDLNDSSHDSDNVDIPIPKGPGVDFSANVVDRQMRAINQMPG